MSSNRDDRYVDKYPDVLFPEEAGAILGIGRTTMYKLLRTGQLKSVRVGNQYRIPKSYLLQYINDAK